MWFLKNFSLLIPHLYLYLPLFVFFFLQIKKFPSALSKKGENTWEGMAHITPLRTEDPLHSQSKSMALGGICKVFMTQYFFVLFVSLPIFLLNCCTSFFRRSLYLLRGGETAERAMLITHAPFLQNLNLPLNKHRDETVFHGAQSLVGKVAYKIQCSQSTIMDVYSRYTCDTKK